MARKLTTFSLLFFLFVSFISYVHGSSSDNKIFIGGHFLETYLSSSGSTKHASSFVAYSIDEDQLDDDLGGVLIDNNELTTLVATSAGIYASGPFNFADYDYSNTITEYDPDDDEWTSLNDGIWCWNCVDYIAAIGETVFFAGNGLTTLEQLPNTTLSGIVMMDSVTEDFFPLEDPNGIFPTDPDIAGLAASSKYLYVYEVGTNTIYQYNLEEGDFTRAFYNFDMTIYTGTLVTAANDDIYVFAYTIDYYTISLSLYYWPANYTAGQAPEVIPIKTGNSMGCSPPYMTPYQNGVLISNPDPLSNCSASFILVENGKKRANSIPYSPYPVEKLSGGASDEIWISTITDEGSIIYYWNSTFPAWGIISLNDIGIQDFVVSKMTYSTDKESLYVYVIDNTEATSSLELVQIKSENVEVTLKDPGFLSTPGYIYGIAYDPNNDVLYVGGIFSSAGGTKTTNLAYYSFSDEEWQGFKGADRIEGLANIESIIYIIYMDCGTVGQPIPFDAYGIDQDVDVKGNLPVFYEDQGCLLTISTNSTHVYIGGSFVVQVNYQLAYGLLVYYPEEDSWSTLPIDESIKDKFFQILSITEFEYNDNSYIAIGGSFDFTAQTNSGSVRLLNFAIWNITSQSWLSITSPSISRVQSIVYMYDGILVFGGVSKSGASSASVMSYSLDNNTYSFLSGIKNTVNSLLLYTYNSGNPDQYTQVYAGGNSSVSGVERSNYTNPVWYTVGNIYDDMYQGYVNVLSYSTGGNGAGGVNGNNNNSGSDWWWITLLVIGSILVIVVVIVAVVATVIFLKKKERLKYSSLT